MCTFSATNWFSFDGTFQRSDFVYRSPVHILGFQQLLSTCSSELQGTVSPPHFPSIVNLGFRASVSGILGSLPNIRKNGLSLACSFGRKLYAAVAIGQTSSHSKPGPMCFAMHALRNKWNPSILPLDWGW